MPWTVRLAIAVFTLVVTRAPIAAQDSTAAAVAPAARVRAAERLLAVTDAERLNALMIEQMQRTQLTQMPQLAPYADIMNEFFAEHLSWDKVRPETVQLYTEVFTTAELEELIAFYQSPLGKKLLAKSPEIMTRAMALAQRRLERAMPAVLQRIQERATQSAAPPPTEPSAGSPARP
jgi:uncharacterized protein